MLCSNVGEEPLTAVAGLPSSPCLVSTKIVEARVAAGILVPLVVMGMFVAESRLPVPAACTAPSTSQQPEFLSLRRQWCQCLRTATRETSAVQCHELAGGLGHHARGFHSIIYETFLNCLNRRRSSGFIR